MRAVPGGLVEGRGRPSTPSVQLWPDRYPLAGLSLEDMLASENRFLRSVDYGVIAARIDGLYASAARALGEPRVESLVRDGVPSYVWPNDPRAPWLESGRRRLPRLLAWATGVARPVDDGQP